MAEQRDGKVTALLPGLAVLDLSNRVPGLAVLDLSGRDRTAVGVADMVLCAGAR